MAGVGGRVAGYGLGWDWAALDDMARLFPLEKLTTEVMTDRPNDTADYVSLFGSDVVSAKPFVNIGAGDWTHPCWSNHDFVQPPYDKYTPPRYNIDLSKMERWPIEDASILAFFTSHTIEHLTNEMVMHVFEEVARTLKPGGIFRVTTPDYYTAYAAWRIGDGRYYDHRSSGRMKKDVVVITTAPRHTKGGSLSESFLLRVASCLGRVTSWKGRSLDDGIRAEAQDRHPDDLAEALLEEADFARKRPSQHINWWTEEKLRTMLSQAGFRLVLRSSYGQCLFPLMRNKAYFDCTRPNESILVDAVR